MDQHEEDCLKGILGVVFVAQDCAADAQHHRTMTFDQRREGELGRIVPGRSACELFQELTVSQFGGHPLVKYRTEVPQSIAVLFNRHGIDLGSNSR